MTGKETVIGEAVLDLERLRQYRVVLPNYETVTNYQHSFARMKDHWTVVVTDEAQEYKTPNTKISHALKSLAPGFRIACTGTPVETRLLDVWNLFDFLQPGYLLGSAAEFTKTYETPIEQQPTADSSPVLSRLKERLSFGHPCAFVLRRGARVFLTPRAGDGGIDVIAVREREIHLIQCKHTLWDANVDANVIAEVISAFDGYRARFLKALPRAFAFCPVLVTNGSFTARARAEVRGRDVQLVANTDLWQLLNETPCTLGDIEAMEGRRLASLRDVQVAIECLVRSSV